MLIPHAKNVDDVMTENAESVEGGIEKLERSIGGCTTTGIIGDVGDSDWNQIITR